MAIDNLPYGVRLVRQDGLVYVLPAKPADPPRYWLGSVRPVSDGYDKLIRTLSAMDDRTKEPQT